MPISRSPGKLADLVQNRHPGVQEAARWLEPNDRLPGALLTIATAFHDMTAWLLGQIPTDDPQLTHCLNSLTHAKDYAVRAAIAAQEAANGDQ